MEAVRCPVCDGRGKLPPQGDFSNYYETPCHGCNEWGSRGWIVLYPYVPSDDLSTLVWGTGDDVSTTLTGDWVITA